MALLSVEYSGFWVEVAGWAAPGGVTWRLGGRTELGPPDWERQRRAMVGLPVGLPGRGPIRDLGAIADLPPRSAQAPAPAALPWAMKPAQDFQILLPRAVLAQEAVVPTRALADGRLPALQLAAAPSAPRPAAMARQVDPPLLLTLEGGGRVLCAAGIGFGMAAPGKGEAGAPERSGFAFAQRLPFFAEADRLVLRQGGKELGALELPRQDPRFELLAPAQPPPADRGRPVAIRWRALSKEPLSFRLRFAAEGRWRGIPGIPVDDGCDVPLEQLPGGACEIQVLASNGYRTSYVELPRFRLPRRSPCLTLFNGDGPVLAAAAWSDEEGQAAPGEMRWRVEGGATISGVRFDVRRLGPGAHRLWLSARFPSGAAVERWLGPYDGRTGFPLEVRQALGPGREAPRPGLQDQQSRELPPVPRAMAVQLPRRGRF